MKAAIMVAIVLLVAACGQPLGKPTSAVESPRTATSATVSPGPSASPGAVAAATPTAKPSSMVTPKVSPTLLFAVLETKGTATASTYNTVAIAGLDGYARAKTTFAPMPVPVLGCMGAILPPQAHVAAGRVYFADARGVIRSLAIDGKVTTVATFPMTSSQQMLSFAVSPDGAHVIGTVFTVPKNAFSCSGPSSGTFTFDAYSATSSTTNQLVYHQSWTTPPANVMSLSGWDTLGPFGTYPSIWASQGGGPGSTLGVYVRIDAATLKPGAQFSDPSKCQVWSSAPNGAFVCIKDPTLSGQFPVSVRNANGTESWSYTFRSSAGAATARLAPDGRHVTLCCADAKIGFASAVIGKAAGQLALSGGFYSEAWLDSQTLVGSYNASPTAQPPFKLAYVALNAPSYAVSLGFTGIVVGTVRA